MRGPCRRQGLAQRPCYACPALSCLVGHPRPAPPKKQGLDTLLPCLPLPRVSIQPDSQGHQVPCSGRIPGSPSLEPLTLGKRARDIPWSKHREEKGRVCPHRPPAHPVGLMLPSYQPCPSAPQTFHQHPFPSPIRSCPFCAWYRGQIPAGLDAECQSQRGSASHCHCRCED